MTSYLHRRASSIFAVGAIAALIAFIVLLWCVFAKQNSPSSHQPPSSSTFPNNEEKTKIESESEASLPSHVVGYVKDINTELIRLVKLGPQPLQGHDVIFDIQKSLSENATNDTVEHHSGHFRHPQTELWDPHPQYVIEAFGFKLHLILRHTPPPSRHRGGLHVTHVYRNHTRRLRLPGTPDNGSWACFYTGEVKGQPLPQSDVAVSLCGGMTGYIRSKEGNFYIEPAETYKNLSTQTSLLHRIHRVITSTAAEDNHIQDEETCDTVIPDDNNQVLFDDIISSDPLHHIRKRSNWNRHYYQHSKTHNIVIPTSYHTKNREYFIETLVVADKSMAEYHGSDKNLIHYILTLMSHVAFLYKDATIGNPISMSVVHIMILKDREFVRTMPGSRGVDSAEMLRQFCVFQASSAGHNHDVALLLTRETICRDVKSGQCDTLGLAELGTMCMSSSSCAIIKDKGLPTSYTIAHELGHVLNMPHDDDYDKCSRFNLAGSGVKYIMGRMIQNDSKPWLWSNCSRKYLNEYLESGRVNCLLDEPQTDLVADKRSFPGETFTGDRQCELVFGSGLKLCPYMPPCTYLWCELEPERDEGCQTQHQPWADGTACAPGYWCHRGDCVPRDPRLLEPLAGGWGEWKPWGQCSRTCGGGVRRAERECDSPAPANGGPYCLGPSVRYDSCNTEPCDELDSQDFREFQCARFNGNSRGIPGLHHQSTIRWIPKYGGIPTDEQCKLYCRLEKSNQHYLLADRVIDGTSCGLNSFHICVAGVCRAAGCDHRLGSNLTLNACGVCGGDNSQCEEISGTYNAKPVYGYSRVVRIPRGSSNLDIQQRGFKDERDGNYLALVDAETGRYILNGDHLVSAFSKVLMYGGVTLEYTGSKSAVERINSSGSLRLKKDLLVELLSVDRLLPPNITYRYMISKGSSPKYNWQLYTNSFTVCSRLCQGVRHPRLLCTSVQTGNVVDDAFCEHIPRDLASGFEPEPCNSHCRVEWQVQKRLPCSVQCGRGVQTVLWHCIKFGNNAEEEIVDDKHCSDLKRPNEVEDCEGLCEEGVKWKYDEWSECSATCGTGVQTRVSWCVDAHDVTLGDDSPCQGISRVVSQPCNVHRCPTWTIGGDWTPCSATCGLGYRTQPYHCNLDGRVLRPEACDPAQRPVVREPCIGEFTCPRPNRKIDFETTNTVNYEWRTGPWSECSRSCGGGIKSRNVQCQGAENIVHEHKCDSSLKPVSTVSCASQSCPKWNHGDWTKCMPECKRYRLVLCQEHNGVELPPERCSQSERPINSTQCWDTPLCNANTLLPVAPRYKWRLGRWSSCTRTCGQGIRTRSVNCVDIGRNANVVSEFCANQRRPKSQRICVRNACTPKWQAGPWTECTPSCGEGSHIRNVTCQHPPCNPHTKPASYEKCYVRSCGRNEYTWMAGPWRECSHPCGSRGRQIRRIYCLHRNKKVPKKYCSKLQKPQRKQRCNHRKCLPSTFRNCLDVKRGLHTINDGEYKMSIGVEQLIQIYCHNMKAAIPEEFITLKDDGRENYAEIYGKQLLKPSECPRGGQRHDDCLCRDHSSGIAGVTVFYRVRLNITSMQIIPNDFTFTRQISGSQPVPYASAGDCYSLRECPQGRFSINLTGTGLKLHSHVSWLASGSHASLIITKHTEVPDLFVSGKCGGYCGNCAPNPRLGLLIEPDLT